MTSSGSGLIPKTIQVLLGRKFEKRKKIEKVEEKNLCL